MHSSSHAPLRAVWAALVAVVLAAASVIALPSAASAAGSFSAVNTPVVSGSGVVGSSFTATLDTVGTTPAPTGITYVWHRADDSSVVPSDGGPTLAVTSALLGKQVYVVAVLTATDTADYTTLGSAYSNVVRVGSFSGVKDPVVTGSGRIGSTFTATLDTVGTTPTPSTVAFTWHRVDTGAVVQTGGSTLTATSALLGTGVYVIATLSADGTADYVTLNSPFSTTVHLDEFDPGTAPVLSGRNTVGGTLTASVDTSTWAPMPTAVSWQWFLQDGTPLTGQAGASLAMTDALVGQVVYAEATLTAPDTHPYVIATAPSGMIARPGVATGDTTSVVAGGTVPVTAWGLLLLTSYDLELHSTPVALGSVVSGADGTIATTVTIPADTPAGRHRIVLLRDGVEVAAVTVNVTAPAGANTLPATGASGSGALGTAAGGLLLVVAGLTIVLARRRVRRA